MKIYKYIGAALMPYVKSSLNRNTEFKNIKRYNVFLVVMLLFVSSCEKDDVTIMTLTVTSQKEIFRHPLAGERMGYVATDSENHELHIDGIDGFDDQYEEGYKYVIVVKAVDRYKNGKPVEDGFGISYYLIKIISKVKV